MHCTVLVSWTHPSNFQGCYLEMCTPKGFCTAGVRRQELGEELGEVVTASNMTAGLAGREGRHVGDFVSTVN